MFVVILTTSVTAADKLPIHVLSGHNSPVLSICVSPDAKLLVSGSIDGDVRLWHLKEQVTSRELPKHEKAVTGIDISPSGQFLATSSFSRKIHLLSLSDFRQINTFQLPAEIWDIRFIDGNTLVSGAGVETVRSSSRDAFGRLDLISVSDERRKQLKHFDDIVVSLAFAPKANRLAVARYNGICDVFDVPSLSIVNSLTSENGLTCSAISTDGRFVAIPRHADRKNAGEVTRPIDVPTEIQLFDVEKAEVVRGFNGHTAPVMSVAFSSDNQLLATASWDRTVRLWDVGTGQLLETFEHTRKVWSVTFAAEGTIASGSSDGSIRLWRLSR